MEIEKTEPGNYVKIVFKQSSSSGKLGWDVDCKCSQGADEKEMKRLAELALLIAKGARDRL